MKNKNNFIKVMIGSGDNAIFVKKKRGEKYMLSDGTVVRAGTTPEDSMTRLDDRIDDSLYNNSSSLVRKLGKRIRRR